MTWSIVARDKATGCFGIAVATKFFAAGSRVPFVAAGIGVIATQALVNPFYGTNGLRLLREGMAADTVVKTLVAADDGRDHRQIHVMDATGRSHVIHKEQPQLVFDSIREVVEAVRNPASWR